MDSGNSGSLQSSSGGDDEFDSRGGGGGGVDSSPLSALFRPAPSPSSAAFSLYGLQEFAPPQQQQQAGLWSGSFTGAAGASSSSSPRVAGSADQGGARQQRQQQSETTSAATAHQGSAPPPQQPAPPRGSRKRTRASRRAPTTVLTTDTSNFRAMVQEFTGIPSPPFAAAPAASALRTRFDHIFPPSSSLLRSAAAGGDASASLPPYLLRPFAQKIPSAFPPFTSSSSSSSPLASSSIGVANANAAPGAASGPSSSNPTAQADTFQLTSSALLRLQQDPSSYLSFQNLLDSQSSSHSIFGAAGGFAPPRMHDPAPSPSEFLSGNLGGLMAGSSEGMHLHHPRSDVHQHGGDELSGVVASGGICKPINYSTHAGGAATSSSAAAASGDKPPDGGAPGPARPARGEGLDPWICTSE
ncbi:hypothetical protein PR202_gb22789 [Eleusine coracana subsp. coracana]|uniref:VQ domain-containing protein n=1 Tax=Eleusine coracana subsp. coracana TaxID=191504 RepID=A0AAV5FH81_ELECO|nr:hypothetical protein QOZ80_6AG0533610 [Eleusine coracana subsp. coracana]GJN34146.1 hypothetical protein PR202_gb22789 [Eleusine coracana subsp. coracana]